MMQSHQLILTFLRTVPAGVRLQDFDFLYADKIGIKLDFHKYGYSDLIEMLKSVPNVIPCRLTSQHSCHCPTLKLDKHCNSMKSTMPSKSSHLPQTQNNPGKSSTRLVAVKDSNDHIHHVSDPNSSRQPQVQHRMDMDESSTRPRAKDSTDPQCSTTTLSSVLKNKCLDKTSTQPHKEQQRTVLRETEELSVTERERRLRQKPIPTKFRDDKQKWELYVANFSPDATEEELLDVFKLFGCNKIRLKKPPDKWPFAFAQFDDYERAAEAFYTLDATDFHGRRLRIAFSRSSIVTEEDYRQRRVNDRFPVAVNIGGQTVCQQDDNLSNCGNSREINNVVKSHVIHNNPNLHLSGRIPGNPNFTPQNLMRDKTPPNVEVSSSTEQTTTKRKLLPENTKLTKDHFHEDMETQERQEKEVSKGETSNEQIALRQKWINKLEYQHRKLTLESAATRERQESCQKETSTEMTAVSEKEIQHPHLATVMKVSSSDDVELKKQQLLKVANECLQQEMEEKDGGEESLMLRQRLVTALGSYTETLEKWQSAKTEAGGSVHCSSTPEKNECDFGVSEVRRAGLRRKYRCFDDVMNMLENDADYSGIDMSSGSDDMVLENAHNTVEKSPVRSAVSCGSLPFDTTSNTLLSSPNFSETDCSTSSLGDSVCTRDPILLNDLSSVSRSPVDNNDESTSAVSQHGSLIDLDEPTLSMCSCDINLSNDNYSRCIETARNRISGSNISALMKRLLGWSQLYSRRGCNVWTQVYSREGRIPHQPHLTFPEETCARWGKYCKLSEVIAQISAKSSLQAAAVIHLNETCVSSELNESDVLNISRTVSGLDCQGGIIAPITERVIETMADISTIHQTSTSSVAESSIKNNVPTESSCQTHAGYRMKGCASSRKMRIPREMEVDFLSRMYHDTCPLVKPFRTCDFPPILEIFVTHVPDEEYIWGQLINGGHYKRCTLAVHQMMEQLDSNSLPLVTRRTQKRAAVHYDSDLCRVWVMSITESESTVFYIDYGNIGTVMTSSLLLIPDECWQISPIAVPFHVIGCEYNLKELINNRIQASFIDISHETHLVTVTSVVIGS